jgi:DNA-directed RNA polymerase specialized sigma24 family protein
MLDISAPSDLIERLYRAAYRVSVGYARKLVGNAMAEDVAQEVFLRLLRYKRTAERDLTISFVLSVTHNVAVTMRGGSKRRSQIDGECFDFINQGRPNHNTNSSAPADATERVRQLPQSLYDLVMMTEVQGLSERQAGLALSLPRSAVNAKRRSALKSLRDTMTTEDRPRFMAAG